MGGMVVVWILDFKKISLGQTKIHSETGLLCRLDHLTNVLTLFLSTFESNTF